MSVKRLQKRVIATTGLFSNPTEDQVDSFKDKVNLPLDLDSFLVSLCGVNIQGIATLNSYIHEGLYGHSLAMHGRGASLSFLL